LEETIRVGVEVPEDGEEVDGESKEENPCGRAEVRREDDMRPVTGERCSSCKPMVYPER
jgi:hypothetical protein